jgi:thiol-disulfide isomerase/thioredoxin
LLKEPGAGNFSKALAFSTRAEQLLREQEKKDPGPRDRGRVRAELDAALGRVILYQARALGQLGKVDEAITAARRSFAANPSAEASREAAHWLEKAGKLDEAISALADAFVLNEAGIADVTRAQDRLRMAELYRKVHGASKGLGDEILAAYDRAQITAASRLNRLRAVDPNAGLTNPMEFTLSSLSGQPLQLSTLRGKVVVMDFWATWCAPCRAQRPLFDEVKRKFAGRDDVVFLAVNTDEDRSVVPGFVEAQKWDLPVYFEDGLGRLLRISSIPTTVVFSRKGEVLARLNGFVPDRFVETLTDRIHAALAQ